VTATPGERSVAREISSLTIALVRHRALAIRRDWKSRSLHAFALMIGIGVFCTILLGTYSAVRILEGAAAYGLLDSIPAWAFLVYLFTDILIAFGQALGDLYLSRDMALLLAMPLRMPSIIVAKFALGVAQNEVYAIVFLLPFAVGYLLGVDAAPWTIPVAAAAVLVFPATLYAALLVVTIAAVRVIPPKIAKEGLWLIGASVPTIFWFLSFYRVAHIGGDVATMRLPEPSDLLPSTWIGNALAMLGEGDTEAALSWLWLLVTATFLACPVAIAYVSTSFAQGWSATVTATANRQDVRATPSRVASPVAALATKDLKTFWRSPPLWFNHIAALGFVGYLIVGHSVQTPLLPLTVQLAMVQVGFVAVLGALNPGMTALSLEHLAIWVLKAAPLRAEDILRSKLGVAFAQTGTITGVGAAALSYGYGFSPLDGALLVAFGLGASASAICAGIAFDAAHPSFDWENPNHISRGVRMLVPFLVNVGVLAVCTVLLFSSRAMLGGTAALVAGLAACMLIQAIAAAASMRAARRDFAALDV
jgi:hypothetical protein